MSKITVFTKNNCPQCMMTKTLLDNLGVNFEQINIDKQDTFELSVKQEDGTYKKSIKNSLNYVKNELGFSSLPVVKTEDNVFAGFQPEKLNALSE